MNQDKYRTKPIARFNRTLLLRAMTAGKARWEPFQQDADSKSGEVCVGGLRFSTQLDEAGCPFVHEPLGAALYKAVGGFSTATV